MDLGEYTLKSRSEIDEIRDRVGHERFDKFKQQVFETLRNIKLGEEYRIEENVSAGNFPAFIKLTCLYIKTTGWNCNIDLVGSETNIVRGVLTPWEHQAHREEYFRKRELKRS